MTTARERVQEALGKAYQMLDEVSAAKAVAQEARNAYNKLKAEQNAAAIEKERDEAMAQIMAAEDSDYARAIDRINDKLARAKDAYEKARTQAKRTYDDRVETITAEWEQKVAQARHQLDMEAAGAQAEAHTAEQTAANLDAALSRYCDNVKQQLGIDLRGLLEVGGV